MGEKTDEFLVTVPANWKVREHAKLRKFVSIQEYVRELIRRDIEDEGKK